MHVFDIFVILTDTDVVTIKNIFKKSAFVTYYISEVEELNGKVQFSSKVHFFGELELNLVHFLAK